MHCAVGDETPLVTTWHGKTGRCKTKYAGSAHDRLFNVDFYHRRILALTKQPLIHSATIWPRIFCGRSRLILCSDL